MIEHNNEFNSNKQLQVIGGLENIDPKIINDSVKFYEDYRSAVDRDLKIGLYGGDIEEAIKDQRSTLIKYENNSGGVVYAPLLVPVDKLEWYNREVLEQMYGSEAKLFYYAHPPILDQNDEEIITGVLSKYVDDGFVVFTDRYINEPQSAKPLFNLGASYELKKLGTGEEKSGVEVFSGEVRNLESNGVFTAPSLNDLYDQLVETGELARDETNGVTLARTIDGEEAKRIWDIYQQPFDELGQDHPTYAGFDQSGLEALLADPEIIKIVNRVQGKISTLCLFVQDFNHCPWFNKSYYEQNYPEYYKTNNILIFPGIVSDPAMRGQNYSFEVINLANYLLAKRGSDFMITFECTEISATYIPRIVKGAVEASGYSEVHGLEAPTTKIDYIGVSKPS